MMHNELPITAGRYYLMRDVDRYSDAEFDSIEDARTALDAAIDDGEEKMWIAYGEVINDRVELMFEEGYEQ